MFPFYLEYSRSGCEKIEGPQKIEGLIRNCNQTYRDVYDEYTTRLERPKAPVEPKAPPTVSHLTIAMVVKPSTRMRAPGRSRI